MLYPTIALLPEFAPLIPFMHAEFPSQIAFVPQHNLQGRIRPPGSKSITNRALICAALGSAVTSLQNILISEDTEVMIQAWRQIGVAIDVDHAQHTCRVTGCCGRPPNPQAEIFVANSGTTIRFLTSALAACQGEYLLDGIERMRARPISDLIEALKELNVDIESLNSKHPGCPPIRLRSSGLAGGSTRVAGDISSQFISSLLMASPYAQSDMEIELIGELVSRPYVEMTIAVMRSFGVEVENDSNRYRVKTPQQYRVDEYVIEPDASAASYFLAAAAITQGAVNVEGLGSGSLQGDVKFAHVLREMGCEVEMKVDSIHLVGKPLHGMDVDMSAISDTVQTLAAVALFAKGPTHVRGVAHNRFKETDRIGDLARELRRVGATVDEHHDGMTIIPNTIHPAIIETYNDHRMAMSMSLIGLAIADIWIKNPACTTKTYPDYFSDMSKCFGLETKSN